MNKTLTYLRLQAKSIRRLLPAVLALSLVLCGAMGVMLSIFIKSTDNPEQKKKMSIGVVGETEDSYLGFGFVTIMDLDVTRYSIDFIAMTEKEARAKLETNELTAYVIIPDDFIDKAASGTIVPLTYATSPGATGIGSIFKEEVLDGIVDILESSERAIYGLQEALGDIGVTKDVTKRMDMLYNIYINLVMSRANATFVNEAGISGGVSMHGYFLCSILIMFFTVWGITCCTHFSERSVSLMRLFASKGNGALSQITGEYFSYLITMLIALGVTITGCAFVARNDLAIIPELADKNVGYVLVFALRLLPAILVVSAMQFMIYEAIDGVVPAVLSQFTAALALSYVSGLMYPIDFFPDAVQKLASVLPTGIAREYAVNTLLGGSILRPLLLLFVWFAVFTGITLILRKRKIVGRSLV